MSSFSGLRSLAVLAGWVPALSPLLPLTVDALAMTATRVWLAQAFSSHRARRFARTTALGAILLSLTGNATDHLLTARLLGMSWVIVVAVGAVPPVVLGLVVHLAVLRSNVEPAVLSVVSTPPDSTVRRDPGRPRTEPRGASGPYSRRRTPYRSEADLVAAARTADAAWRRTHDGRGIPRDALRRELGVSAARASAVLRGLRTDQPEQSSTEPEEAHSA